MPNCKFCGKPIMFKLTEKGHRMPIDVETVTAWNINATHCMPLKVYTSHFATCPRYKGKKRGETSRTAVQRQISEVGK